MRKINLSEIDVSLLADLGDNVDGFEAFEADYPRKTVGNQAYHIVYNAAIGRGGIVFVGSGSTGNTFWTDAASAEDVLARYIAGLLTG